MSRRWVHLKAALVGTVVVAVSLLRLFPNALALGDPLSLVAVAALYACGAAFLALRFSLPAFGAVAAVLFFVRRPWAGRVAVGFVAIHWLLLSLVLVETSALFVFPYFRYAAPLAALAYFALRLRKSLAPWKRLNLALNGLVVLSVATYFANAAEFLKLPGLAATFGAAQVFPGGNNYDVAVAPDGGGLINVGFGGGVYSLNGTDFPPSIRASDKTLLRPERFVVLDDHAMLTNNAVGRRDLPDAVQFHIPDLAGRREIRLDHMNRVVDIGLDPATRRLLFVDEEAPLLAVWDLDAWRLVKEVVLDTPRFFNANKVTVDAAARRAYVGSWLQGRRLYEVDLDALALARTAPVGVSVSDIAVDAGRNALYLARPLLSRIDVLDRQTLRRTGGLPTIAGVRKLLWIPDRDLLVAGSFFTGELEAIDMADPARRTRIKAFPRIRGLYYDAPSGRVWIASLRGVFTVPVDRLAPWTAAGR